MRQEELNLILQRGAIVKMGIEFKSFVGKSFKDFKNEKKQRQKYEAIDDLFGINHRELNNEFHPSQYENISGGEEKFLKYVRKMYLILGKVMIH